MGLVKGSKVALAAGKKAAATRKANTAKRERELKKASK